MPSPLPCVSLASFLPRLGSAYTAAFPRHGILVMILSQYQKQLPARMASIKSEIIYHAELKAESQDARGALLCPLTERGLEVGDAFLAFYDLTDSVEPITPGPATLGTAAAAKPVLELLAVSAPAPTGWTTLERERQQLLAILAEEALAGLE